jgi:hypothetical protein
MVIACPLTMTEKKALSAALAVSENSKAREIAGKTAAGRPVRAESAGEAMEFMGTLTQYEIYLEYITACCPGRLSGDGSFSCRGNKLHREGVL